MTQYIEDLVQEIYTRCDTSGLDKLNKGLEEAAHYTAIVNNRLDALREINKQSYEMHSKMYDRQQEAFFTQKQYNKLQEQQANIRRRQIEADDIYARRKAKRDAQEINHMQKRNALQGFFVKALGAYFSINTVKNIIQTGSKLQLLRQSIIGLTKDVQDWDYIQKTAHATGNSLEIVARGYKNFYAAANMAGFNKNSIQSMYSDMVMATRAIGASSQQTEGALVALEQMISKGTVSMEELRRQLGNAVPGAFEIGAKAMNMTTQEFNKFVRTGQLASAVFVPKFIAEFKRQYADGFKEISGTFDFAMNQLKESWQELQLEIMHGEIGKELANIIKSIDKLIRSREFKAFISIAAKIIGFVIDHLPLILFLLGANGLFRLIGNNANAMALLNMQWKEGIILASLFAKDGITAFLANSKAAMVFHGKLLAIIVALATVDDMFTGILHFFGLTDRDSYTGRLLDAMAGRGSTNIGTDAPGGNTTWRNREDVKKAKERYEEQRKEGKKLRLKGQAWNMLGLFGLSHSLPYMNVGRQMIDEANRQLEYIKKEEQNMNLNYTVYVVDQTGNADKNIQRVVIKTLDDFFNQHNKKFSF